MIHHFADNYTQWFNSYELVDMVQVNDGHIVTAQKPIFDENVINMAALRPTIGFLFDYWGMSLNYYGQIVTDGVLYAYIKGSTGPEEHPYAKGQWPVTHTPRVQEITGDMLEAYPLNLYVRSMLRASIRRYIEGLEAWPI